MAFPEAKLRLGPILFVMIISERVWTMLLITILLARKSEMGEFKNLKGALDNNFAPCTKNISSVKIYVEFSYYV